MTIGDRLSSRDNALNFVRLALAATVIVSHAWPVGGFGDSPVVGLGGWAVDGFFVLSGYLIAGSRMRNAFLPYLWRRALRVLPAFWVCLIVTAAVIAPVTAAVIGETYRLESGVGYVVRNAALSINQWGIDDTLLDVPLAGVWNSPLWTLFFEFGAYVFAGVILSVPLLRRHGALSSAVLFVLIVVFQPLAYGPLDTAAGRRCAWAFRPLLWTQLGNDSAHVAHQGDVSGSFPTRGLKWTRRPTPEAKTS